MILRRTRARLFGVLVVAAMTGAVLPTGTSVAAAPQAGTPQAAPERTVTLLTGDVVTTDGRSTARVRPGPGRERIRFAQRTDERGDLHVVPEDAQGLVSTGRLDPRLFDVTELIRAGYDDASRQTTPLIITNAAMSTQLTGGTAVRALASVDGVALTADKTTAFWAGLRTGQTLAGGVDRIWLDGPVHTTLDHSVPQIGAPDAWQGGHTGQNSTVAVLDTGIDAGHPDLADAVVEAKDFTDSASGTDDRVGHGTHVASTITGDGAASAGKYRGVAPDTRLLVGKVLGDSGGGSESGVIAGMEWAAAADADVVNMSLGSPWPSDGTDVVSQAVNRLTAETGTLFVVSAGNSGPRDESIGSPAAADSALTVGAVNRDDALAEFSSRGPRWIDGAIKPDITAPGVDIVAARARNGFIGVPVGDKYTTLSGTSMAAPHVAGAAAILAGQHPDWTAVQLKAALMGSAKPNPALTAYQQGAGRVDVARAAAQNVFATPSTLSQGTARWPHHDDQPVVRTVTYQNTGTEPATLHVAADLLDPAGKAAPAGMVTASPADVTVPAGGQVAVTITTDTAVDSPDGLYGGAVVASGGPISVRTPIGFTKEVESYDVRLTFLGFDGAPTPDYFYRFVNIDHRKAHVLHDPSGTVVTRMPKGRYYFEADISPRGKIAQFVEPGFAVTKDEALVVDARDGKPIEFEVDKPNARPGEAQLHFAMKTTWGNTGHGMIMPGFDDVHVRPSRTTAPEGMFTFAVKTALAEPDGKGGFTGSPYLYNLSWSQPGAVPAQLSRKFADRDLAKVRSEFAAQAPGKTGQRNGVVKAALPFTLTEFYSPDQPFHTSMYQYPSPTERMPEAGASTAAWRTYRLGRTTVERWNAAVFGPAFPHSQSGPAAWAAREVDDLDIQIPVFVDQDPTHAGYSMATGSTSLFRDGMPMPIAHSPYTGSLYATVQPGKTAYRLRTEATRDGVSELSTKVSAEWTFSSEHVAGEEKKPLPLLAIRFAPTLDEHNRAAAGRAFAFPVYVQRNGSDQVGRVNRPTVQVSYDEGATWRPAPVVRTGDRWLAAVLHPKDAKFVSLKASTGDADGNTVGQTIIRAYALK